MPLVTGGRSADATGGVTDDFVATDEFGDAAKSTPPQIAIGFVHALRRAGLAVPVSSSVAFYEALALVGLDTRSGPYWAGRSTLVHSEVERTIFDMVFTEYFEGGPPVVRLPGAIEHVTLAIDDPDGIGGDRDGEESVGGSTLTVRYSDVEVLTEKDFADYTEAELANAHELMAALRFTTISQPSRRLIRSRRGQPDLRRTVRRSLRTGGEPVERCFRRRSERPRRLVLLLDVSGSMDPYARALLRFTQAAVVARRRVEAFAIGTRLTRVTRHLSSHDPEAAIAAATDEVPDWSGGTRLGAAIGEFNDEWGVRGMARGAVVVILSDGWDRGEPAEMSREMERLSRVAHRVVWVNPLKATPGYAPLAQGMAAALPHVDRFIEGHNLRSLDSLVEAVGS